MGGKNHDPPQTQGLISSPRYPSKNMHTMLSAPAEALRAALPLRARRIAGLPAAVSLLLLLFCSPLASFAQTYVSSLTGITGPTYLAIDPNRTIGGTTATWLY